MSLLAVKILKEAGHSYLSSALKQGAIWDSLGRFWEFLALIGHVEEKQKEEQNQNKAAA